MAPPTGLEPVTPWLTVRCSTDWAKEEYKAKQTIRGKPLCRLLHLCQHWAIVPARLQASIVATAKLNFCVRNGNRWTLCVWNTDYVKQAFRFFYHVENPNKRIGRYETQVTRLNKSSSPRSISISQLNTLLCLHPWPIKLVVYKWSYLIKLGGISNLEVCFMLRCFQLLSTPYAATQLCPWQNNWCTGGTFDPVLSY